MKHVTTMECPCSKIVLVTVFLLFWPRMGTDANDESLLSVPKSGLNIFYTNAESIRGKLDILASDSENCAVICLTETWLDHTLDDCALQITGFQPIIRHDREKVDAGTINHGGVAVYVRNDVAFKHRVDLENSEVESIWLEIFSETGSFLLSVIYRPPSERTDYWNILEHHIESARDSTVLPVIICGDFNNNILVRPCQIVPLLQRQGLHVMNHEPTFITQTSSTCLDLFAVSQPSDVDCVLTASPSLSGHACLILCKNTKLPKSTSYSRKVLDYRHTDWLAVNRTLSLDTVHEINATTNLDDFALNGEKGS